MSDTTPDFAAFVRRISQRRSKALAAAIALATAGPEEQLIEAARKAISSYCGSRRTLEYEFNDDGTVRNPKPEFNGPYFLRTMNVHPGFVVEAFRKVGEDRIVAFASPVCVTPSGATNHVREWAAEHGKHISFRNRVFYKGEIKLDQDTALNDNARSAAMRAVTELVAVANDPASPNDSVEVLIEGALKTLEYYYSRKLIFNSRWDANGKWIGPRRPKVLKRENAVVEQDPSAEVSD